MAHPPKSPAPEARLPRLGVHGFDRYEPVILAALVTEDPLLLVGRSGTGKTFLLNTLSEALGLRHRHYNASLVSFDDLVGFPFPDDDRQGVRFLETPATVWGAESVLIDEISRCKPEHQNRLFSLVHERRVQGIAIEGLRYRWAAMNPCSTDQDAGEAYAGSEPLDPALADRFALFVPALDWTGLDDAERRLVADPSGEGRIASDEGRLLAEVKGWRARFLAEVDRCPELVLAYVTTAVTALNQGGVRISPRRARLLARSLLAAGIVTGRSEASAPTEELFHLVLSASLPQLAWGVAVREDAIAAAHRVAWDTASKAEGRWIHAFHAASTLPGKLAILLDECRDGDQGTQALAQLLASEPRERATAFAFAIYPAAALGRLPVGAEAVNDLAKVATPVLDVDGTITWQERVSELRGNHPEFTRLARVMTDGKLRGGRLERARQFFHWSLVAKLVLRDPTGLEAEIDGCVQELRKRGLAG